jgi:peptidoglycan/LPS O-acetylase OafA/YrhL
MTSVATSAMSQRVATSGNIRSARGHAIWPQLEGLRGIAVLLVLLIHTYQFIILDPLWRIPIRFGWSGVDLFFVLSGFLIAGRLNADKSNPHFFSSFYIRRIFRILPLYLALLTVTFGRLQFSGFHSDIPFLAYLFFLQNFWRWNIFLGLASLGPTWTLAIEENFYLVIPFLLRHLKQRNLVYLCICLLVLLPLARVLVCFLKTSPEVAIDMRADGLLFGVLSAFLIHSKYADRFFERKVFIGVGGVLTLLVSFVAIFNEKSFGILIFRSAVGYSAVAAFYAYILLLVIRFPTSFLSKLFQISPLRKLAKISYGVYLIQAPLTHVGRELIARNFHIEPYPSGWFMTATALATILLAALSWRYFEQPIIALGSRLDRLLTLRAWRRWSRQQRQLAKNSTVSQKRSALG